jgi:hypothetical protein
LGGLCNGLCSIVISGAARDTVHVRNKDRKVGAVQLAPTTCGAFFRVDGLGAIVCPQHQHTGGAKLDAQATAFAPIVKDVNLASGQAPLSGARLGLDPFRAGWICDHLCSSSNIDPFFSRCHSDVQTLVSA